MDSRKISKSAFTLAEVLITLGIIGVVAAMTMPTLLNSTQGAQYRTAYKKALSVLSQAIVLNVALDDYDTSQTSSAETASASLYNLFSNRMNVIATNGQGWKDESFTGEGTNAVFGDSADTNYTFFFNDGIVLSFPKTSEKCTESNLCKGVIDVNSKKNPNKIVSCEDETSGNSCKVDSPTDIYPIRFYDQTIVPNSDAARAVMYSGK